MYLNIFKAGYKQWTNNLWVGLMKGPNDEATWEGDKGTFKLKKISMVERRERLLEAPLGSWKKQKLFRIESNKEMTEIGRPPETLYRDLGSE
jgi:hypothetical protein